MPQASLDAPKFGEALVSVDASKTGRIDFEAGKAIS